MILVALALSAMTVPALAGIRDADAFPRPEGLETRVRFWIDVYTRYNTRQAILHDAEHPHVIYGVIELGGLADGGLTDYPESDRERMNDERDRVARILASLASFQGDPERLTPEEQRIYEASRRLPGKHPLGDASFRVRSQRGQRDRFRLGLERAGRYLEAFERLAAEEGVPAQLALLPHVESSFELGALSSAGAAGMWQFMPATARQFLTIDGTRDERLDPWVAARSAFRLLRDNFETLGSWPLAITAYNHGQAGMSRARRKHGDDLVRIIDRYSSRTFGFASKNFYAEFLAVLEIVEEPDCFFDAVRPEPSLVFDSFTLPEYVKVTELARALSVQPDALRELNPALRPGVWSGRSLAPRGYELRVPVGLGEVVQRDWEFLPGSFRFERTVRTTWHKVRRGESLSVIASRYGTSVARLVRLNGMGRRRTIYPSQRLKIRQAERWTPVPSAGSRQHVVRRGETLSAIGRLYGIGVAELARFNGLMDPSRVLVGQVLLIPQVLR